MSRSLIIAEAGVNHDGDFDKARTLVRVAAEAGADIVKFQTFSADTLVTASAPKAAYQRRTTDSNESQHAMLKRLELPQKEHYALKAYAEECGLVFLSTPFDTASAAFLIDLGLDVIKIGSGDMTNAPLLLEIARSGVKLILSTGMANMSEIEDALGVLAFGYTTPHQQPSRKAFTKAWADPVAFAVLREKVTLLHCTTEYPCPPEDANLAVMATLRKAFGLPVGFSDHCEGAAVSIAAATLGATVIEKHITLDRTAPGPDHAASMEPNPFAEMIAAIRTVEKAMGDGRKVPRASEIKNIDVARKSLVAARDIQAGQVLSNNDLTVKRPGNGLEPIGYWDVLSAPAVSDRKAGDLL